MRLPHAPLEERMRDFCFDTKADRGSRGVPDAPPEVLAHIGPRPAAHIDRAEPVDGSGPVTGAYDDSDRRKPWQANPMY